MSEPVSPSVQEVLSTGPQGIRVWLEAHKDDATIARTFHWQGLAESAARRARTRRDPSLASVAIDVYRHWSTLGDESVRESSRLSTMFLRAFFIRELGAETGDPVRDIHALVRDFEDGLSLSVPEAAATSEEWPKLEVSKIRELRRIKDRLGPFELLDPNLLDQFPSVTEWLSIRDQLP